MAKIWERERTPTPIQNGRFFIVSPVNIFLLFFFFFLNFIFFWSLWGESKNGGREERQELGERSSFPRETHKRQKISNMYKNIRKETQLKGIDLLSCVCYRGHIYLIWPRLFFFSHLSIKKKLFLLLQTVFFFFCCSMKEYFFVSSRYI